VPFLFSEKVSTKQKNMSNIEKAIEWLDSEEKDYTEGVLILSLFQVNRTTLRNLSGRSESPERKDKVNFLLCQIVGRDYQPLPGIIPVQPEVEEESQAPAPADVDRTGEPEEIKHLFEAKRNFYNSRNELSQKITDATDPLEDGAELPEEVKAWKEEALKLDDEIKAIDTQIDYFWQNGKVWKEGGSAQVTEPGAETIESLTKKFNNKKSQVSKARAASEKDPGNLEKKEKLAKLEAEQMELRHQIDVLKTSMGND
jgi:hypothetical protein